MSEGSEDEPTSGSPSDDTDRAPSEEAWRTMAGLLGRAWLARERTSVSGAVARAGGPSMIHFGFAPAPSGFGLLPRIPAPEPRVGPGRSSSTLVREHSGTVGGVASFVVDVAAAQPPLDPEASHVRLRSGASRHHRGVHCRLGGLSVHASHNPCQRPPQLG